MLDFKLVENEIQCPYCGYEFSDSWEYGEGESEIYCDECGNTFHYYGEIELNQRIAKDCELNNEEHNFQPYYKELEKCTKCGSSRLKGN